MSTYAWSGPGDVTAVGMPFESDRALPPSGAGSNWGVGSDSAWTTPQVFYAADRPSGTDQIDGSGLDLVGVSGIVPDASGVNIGVQGQVASNATGAGGVLAQSTSASGQTFGLIATAQSPSGAAAFLGSINNADLINSTNNAFNVDGAGNVDATSYAGDGSALTGITVGDGAITTPKLANEAVSNAKLALDAVTSSRILDSSVRSQDIANGTIEIEDMGFAGYWSKQDIYINEVTIDLPDNTANFAIAACNDANDLAITGFCPQEDPGIHVGVTLLSTRSVGWDTPGEIAEYWCTYFRELGGTGTWPMKAKIVCLDVP